jgi:hypothetical protein
MYVNYKQCFQSGYSSTKEHIIDSDKIINRINFDLVTGYVNIKVVDSKKLVVRVHDKIRDHAHVDTKTFDSGISVNHSVINVHSKTPAFSCKTCQHTSVEILIPRSYPHAIAISGLVKVGYVKIFGEVKKNLGNIDVIVELGYIYATHVLSPSVTFTTDIGVIRAYDSIIQNVKLLAHSGAIETAELLSKNIHAVIQYGCSRHYSLTADKVKIDTKFGFSEVNRPDTMGKELDLTVNTEYGNSLTFIDSDNLSFNLGTSKGHMVVEYEDEEFICTMNNETSPTHIGGKCHIIPSLAPKTMNASSTKLNLNTKYGNSYLIAEFEESELE